MSEIKTLPEALEEIARLEKRIEIMNGMLTMVGDESLKRLRRIEELEEEANIYANERNEG